MSAVKSNGAWMPLTLPQLDFWEEFVLNPGRPLSTVAHCLEFKGQVDRDALLRAVSRTAREADVLSVRFSLPPGGGLPLQRCDPDLAPMPVLLDLRRHGDPLGEAYARMRADIDSDLELLDVPLAKQWLIRVGDDHHLWYMRGHHIILDGYAMGLLEQRCARLYAHFLGRGEPGAAFHPFAAFVAEETQYGGASRFADDRRYWRDYLGRGTLPVLRKDAEGYGIGGLSAQVPLSDDFSRRLREMADHVGIGWPDLLVLLTGAYLFHHLPALRGGNRFLLPLWLPFMSRWGSVGAFTPAMVVNLLPLWLGVETGETLGTFLRRQAGDLRKQRAHGRFRIEQIATDQGLGRGSRFFFSPLVNVLPFDPPRFEGCEVRREVLSSGYGDGFNVTYRGHSNADRLMVDLDADSTLTGADDFARHRDGLPLFLHRALERGALDQTPDRLCRMAADREEAGMAAVKFENA